jgi:hypothetical protein
MKKKQVPLRTSVVERITERIRFTHLPTSTYSAICSFRLTLSSTYIRLLLKNNLRYVTLI